MARRGSGRALRRALAVAAVVAAAWACADGPPPASGKPNLLVLMLDTTRADRLGLYGHERPTTPRLDAFARDARVYERALATSNWTLPSHASIFTGLHPHAHGATGSRGWLDDEFVTLAEALAAAGYDTFLFSSNPFVSADHNLAQGFAVAEYSWDEKWQDDIRGYMAGRDYPGPVVTSKFAPFKDAAATIAAAFLAWEAGRDPARPYFAFLNFMEAHRPWYATRAERERFLPPELVEHSIHMDHSYLRRHATSFGQETLDARDRETTGGLYDAVLWHLDEVIGGLLAELEARGALEDTLVAVVADHGDSLGEHGRLGHEYALYDTLLRVPLLIRYPKLFAPGRVSEPVQILDLYPTLLAVAGVPPPEGVAIEGRNLLAYGPEEAHGRALLAEYLRPKARPLNAVAKHYPDFDRARWERPLRSIEVDGYKLIVPEGGEPELYHVPTDPDELHDLAAREPARVEALLGRLDATPATGRAERPPFDAAERERLEALGYVDEEP